MCKPAVAAAISSELTDLGIAITWCLTAREFLFMFLVSVLRQGSSRPLGSHSNVQGVLSHDARVLITLHATQQRAI
jgi:hypothetical protein